MKLGRENKLLRGVPSPLEAQTEVLALELGPALPAGGRAAGWAGGGGARGGRRPGPRPCPAAPEPWDTGDAV